MAQGDQSRACGCHSPARAVACPKNPTGTQTCNRPLCPSLNMSASYFRASFGPELFASWPSAGRPPLSEALGQRCGALLVNFGQWWAASKPKPTHPHEARAPASYAAELAPTMARLANLSRGWRVPTAWVATNPYPMNAGGAHFTSARARAYDMSLCPSAERRFPHVIKAYNEVARWLASEHGLAYIDTWEIAMPLLDLSADGAHYAWGASPVGKPQAVRAMAWVLHALLGSVRHNRQARCLAARR